MKKIIITIFIALFAFVIVGCKDNPDNELKNNKAAQVIIDLISELSEEVLLSDESKYLEIKEKIEDASSEVLVKITNLDIFNTKYSEYLLLKDEQEDPLEEKKELVIETVLTNPKNNDDSYLVYLLMEGKKAIKPGEATLSGFIGPFETIEGKVVFEMDKEYGLANFLLNTEKTKPILQVIVVTHEDYYMRNPLNKETFITFIKNENGENGCLFSPENPKVVIEITDKYPEGVYSLSFPEAIFVIKLSFSEGSIHNDEYGVAIYEYDPLSVDNLGAYSLGKIDRKSEYWETPFFSYDKLEDWSGTIIITDLDTHKRVLYDGYPILISFDELGRCRQGNILYININIE